MRLTASKAIGEIGGSAAGSKSDEPATISATQNPKKCSDARRSHECDKQLDVAGTATAYDDIGESLILRASSQSEAETLGVTSRVSLISTPTSFVFNGAIIWAGRLPPICRAGYS